MLGVTALLVGLMLSYFDLIGVIVPLLILLALLALALLDALAQKPRSRMDW